MKRDGEVQINIQSAQGNLGVFIAGIGGAVATTLIAGIELCRRKLGPMIGSVTQLGHIRIGKRSEKENPLIRELVSLADLNNLQFAGWDAIPDNLFDAAQKASVLSDKHLSLAEDFLREITPSRGAFDRQYVANIDGTHCISGTRREWAVQLCADIKRFKQELKCDRAIVLWCGSTERKTAQEPYMNSWEAFEKALDKDDTTIPPSMIYAYAALSTGCPYINGAPNLSVDVPCMVELAEAMQMPIAGKDFKTGQTLVKTVLAPMFKARMLGVAGWFSTNILGNRDGLVLDDPEAFRSKEATKREALEMILQPDVYPELYRDGVEHHKVRIEYYKPRGDEKEGWDNIDIRGWLDYPMQLKINFLCRDSILAAPVALDLVLFMDLAQRAGFVGVQDWLSFYFKSPMVTAGLYPEHDLFIQQIKLKNLLRVMAGEKPITHLEDEL